MSVSPNFNDRPPGVLIDMLVLHYTGMETAQAALQHLCDSGSQVSAHYLIEEDGSVHRLVDEDKRAWHAGLAWWRGALDVNGRSIGIELVNPGHELGYRVFPDAQMEALGALAGAILRRHPIAPRNVVGHGDVSPRRKQDPGELFDWCALAQMGVGLWPTEVRRINVTEVQMCAMLSAYGYEVADVPAAIAAFQRHFHPRCVDGVAGSETAGILSRLVEMASK